MKRLLLSLAIATGIAAAQGCTAWVFDPFVRGADGSSGALVCASNATATSIIALFTGCSGSQYLGADGACHNASGAGTVTSIGLLGTANQLTVTGASPITSSGSWTLSLPSVLTLPGTVNKITLTPPTTAWTITPAADNQTTTIPAGTLVPNSVTVAGHPLSANVNIACADLTNASAACSSLTNLALVTPNLGTPTAITLTNATGLPLSGLVNQAADTVVMNATGSSAAPTAVAVNNCGDTSHALFYSTTTHSYGCQAITTGTNPPLNTVIAATGSATIANGDNAIVWNAASTTSGRISLTFGETTASTSAGTPYILQVKTLIGSTATPLNVQNSLNGSQTLPALSITPTWNTTGVVDAALLINPTNTASGAASKLIDAQVGGTTQWNVDKAGNTVQLGTGTYGSGSGNAGGYDMINGAATTPAANAWGWDAPATITTSWRGRAPNASPAANQIMLFPAPTSNVSQWTWTTFSSTNLTDTANLVRNNAANTYTTGAQDFTSATSILVSTQTASDNSTKAASTAYVTTAISNAITAAAGRDLVAAASAAVLPNSPTYNNGVSGVGATLTSGSNIALVVDGYTCVLNDRILVKNQATAAQNGIYYCSQVGTGILPWILTRSLDYDQPSDMNNTIVPVANHGTVNALTSWIMTSTVATVGTDAVTFASFTPAGANIVTAVSPGVGLAHFAGSTQTATSSLVVSADLNITTTTCTYPSVLTAIGATGLGTCTVPTIPQNSQSAAYTTVLGDAGKHIYHPGADTTARTWTIDSNANVAYPTGTCISFINDTSAGTVTIAITSDTMILAGAGTTGSRTLAASGIATACKMTSTRWIINGTGLT